MRMVPDDAEATHRLMAADARRVFDALGVMVILLDRDGSVRELNAAASRAFAQPPGRVAGTPFVALTDWGGGAEVRTRLLGALALAAAGSTQRLTAKAGEAWLDLTATPLFEPDGTVSGVVVTAVEADRRLQAETEASDRETRLRAACDTAERAHRAKNRFLAAASHDLRQPAQSLTLFGALLAERLRGHPEMPLVQGMNQAVEAMRTLMDALLDIARLDAGVVVPEVTPLRLGDLFETLRAEYGPRAYGRGLRLHIRSGDVWVRTDGRLLDRLLRNLLDNALKYTGHGGVLIGCRRRGGAVLIDVVDSGVGMPADKLDEIFEEFVQLGNAERDRARGLGLGLAVVKRLSRLLNLPVSVTSRPGRGTRFSVEVPLHIAVGSSSQASLWPDAERACGLALLIDDDDLILESLRMVLEQWGWDVVAAPSGEEALRQLEGAERLPDVIVADYRLRHGRTGVEAIRDVHALVGEAIPAIVLTGDTSPERIRETRRSGFTVLHKPITLTELSGHLAAFRTGGRAGVPPVARTAVQPSMAAR